MILSISLFLIAKKHGRSIRETKILVGFPNIWHDCKINFGRSTFTRKFRIEIWNKSTFRNIWETYITPQYLENVSKIVKKFEVWRCFGYNQIIVIWFASESWRKMKRVSVSSFLRKQFLLVEAIIWCRTWCVLK